MHGERKLSYSAEKEKPYLLDILLQALNAHFKSCGQHLHFNAWREKAAEQFISLIDILQ